MGTGLRNNREGDWFTAGRDVRHGKKYLRIVRTRSEEFWYFFAYYCNLRKLTPSALLVHDEGYCGMFQDGSADRSDFWRDFHAFLARIGRRHFAIKKGELFWRYGRPDQTTLLTGSVEDALLDIWQAPLEAGIEISDWPTVISAADWGRTLTFARPKGVSKKYPNTVSITPMPPKDLALFGVEGAREYMENIIAEEREITAVVRIKNPKRNAPRPRRAPRVGGRHAGHKDLVEAADAAYDQFVEEHEAARLAFRDGHRNVVFPCGTVFWRRVVGVRVASADPPLREVI